MGFLVTFCLFLVAFNSLASGGQPVVTSPPQLMLQWNRSADDFLTNGVTYTVYAEVALPTATNYVAVSGITNNQVGISSLAGGRWTFYATARQGNVESIPSNSIMVSVPAAPSNLRTVVLQYSATLNGPFADALFLKLYPLP